MVSVVSAEMESVWRMDVWMGGIDVLKKGPVDVDVVGSELGVLALGAAD